MLPPAGAAEQRGCDMTRETLEILHDDGAFNPSPRHQELYATHVPFDTMTRQPGHRAGAGRGAAPR